MKRGPIGRHSPHQKESIVFTTLTEPVSVHPPHRCQNNTHAPKSLSPGLAEPSSSSETSAFATHHVLLWGLVSALWASAPGFPMAQIPSSLPLLCPTPNHRERLLPGVAASLPMYLKYLLTIPSVRSLFKQLVGICSYWVLEALWGWGVSCRTLQCAPD